MLDRFFFVNYPEEIVKTYGVSPDSSILARGYTHGLYLYFSDEECRRKYDTAKPHLDLSEVLLPLLGDGMNGLLTIDRVIP